MTSPQLEKRLNILQWVIVILLIAVILVPFILGWWIRQHYPAISTVSIDNVQLVSKSELCPGEPLIYSYSFHAGGSGVLIRDATVRIAEPPRTIIFSTSRRLILDGPIDQTVTEAWHIPPTYLEPETDTIQSVLPGKYIRLFAVSSPSRSTVIAIGSVEFYVRPDCGG